MNSESLSLLAIFTFISTADFQPVVHPSNGLLGCDRNINATALEVLPGGGWDNLRNIEMARVINLSYSQCQTTEDGIYIIPDETIAIAQKASSLDMNSEIINSWLEQKSSTSRSINADASFFTMVNGKFSTENIRIKTHQVKEKSVTTRVQVRHHLYTVNAYPESTLDAHFVRQAMEIAVAIVNNQTCQADYLSEKMVLDYGTHVITSVDAGAILMKEDYLKSSYLTDAQSSQSSVTALAALNFFNQVKFGIGSKESQETNESRNYESAIKYSTILSHGGDLFYPGMTLEKWQESTLNNLIAIDHRGVPINFFINTLTFPDLPHPIVNDLSLSVRKAIDLYYKMNTHPGCADPDSENFNFQANVDDASCEGPRTNLSFGGVFQNCTPLTTDAEEICQQLAVKNPDTGSYSCPNPYTATLLRTEVHTECNNESSGFWSSSYTKCENVSRVKRAQVETYWCYSNEQIPQSSGYLFGGIYGPSLQNTFIQYISCPSNFSALKFLSNGIMICLSNDYEAATKFSVPFGGFFSCESANPLAQNEQRCPQQFNEHLIEISDGCQVLYCVKSGIFTGGEVSPIQLPPFTRPPVITMLATNTVFVMTEGDQIWVRINGSRVWKVAKPEYIVKICERFQDPQSQKQITVIVCGAAVLTALVFVGVVELIVKLRKKNRGRRKEENPRGIQCKTLVETQTEQPPVSLPD